MKYSELLLSYFNNRTHAGQLPIAPNIFNSHTTNSEKTQMLFLSVEYQSYIKQAKFLANGSPALIAGGEFICRWLENKTKEDLLELKVEFLLEQLGLSDRYIHVAQIILLTVAHLTEKF